MATEQTFEQVVTQNDFYPNNKSSIKKWQSVLNSVTSSTDDRSGGFDCNICLESVQDPVVTLCGHLYCWPCIYKWLKYQSVSMEDQDEKQQQCPVCKAEVSQEALIPLYGRGQTAKPSKGKAPNLGIVIPKRPLGPACGVDTPRTPSASVSPHPVQRFYPRDYQHQSRIYYPQLGNYPSSPALTSPNMYSPMIGMLGEMIYGRMFGSSMAYPNSYNFAGNTSPRVRRHLMQADESLNRICFFVLCCVILCLLLF